MITLFWLDERWVLMVSSGLLLLVLAVGGWQLLRRRSRHLPAELWLAGMSLFGLFYMGLGLYPVLESMGLQGLILLAGQIACLCQATAIRAIAGRPAWIGRWSLVLLVYVALYLILQVQGQLRIRMLVSTLLMVACQLWIAWSAVQLGRRIHGLPVRWISVCALGTVLTLLLWVFVRHVLDQPLATSPSVWRLVAVVGALMLFQIAASLAFAELVLDELGRAERQAAERLQRELGRREGQASLQDLVDLVRRREHQMADWLVRLAAIAQPLADARQLRVRPVAEGHPASAAEAWSTLDERLQRARQALEGEFLPDLLREQRLRVATRPCDLGALVRATLDDLPAAWRGRVQADLPERVPRLSAQAWLLRHALRQLLDNAFRHGRGADVRLVVQPAFGRSGLRITVSDQGPGFGVEQLALWSASDAARWPDGRGGAGLGLAVAARVAWLHGGRLQLSAAPAGGACVSMLLPAAGVPLPDDPPPAAPAMVG